MSARSVGMSTTADTASIQRGRASFEALAAVGYHYHVTGRLSNVNVSYAGGRTTIVAHAVEGDSIDVGLERIPHNILSFGPDRNTSAFSRATRALATLDRLGATTP